MADFIRRFNSTSSVPIDNYKCQGRQCNYIAQSAKQLFSHYHVIHLKDPSFQSLCVFDKNCFHTEAFHNVKALSTHSYKYHSQCIKGNENNLQFEHHQSVTGISSLAK